MFPLLFIALGAFGLYAYDAVTSDEAATVKKRPYGPAKQSEFPGGAEGMLYNYYMMAMQGQMDIRDYMLLADDLRMHGFDYESDQVADYVFRVSGNKQPGDRQAA